MSNIAGKAYAINLITPMRDVLVPLNKLMLWALGRPLLQRRLRTRLPELSAIHFARWLTLRDRDFPQLSVEQPKEQLRHSYLIFLGSINCNLQQCVDQLAGAFPNAFSWLCFGGPSWAYTGGTTRLQTLQRNIARNQIWTDYFYSAYPMASANDIRSSQRVKRELCTFILRMEDTAPAEFMRDYHALLKALQSDLGLLSSKAIVSMAARDQPLHAADIPDDTDVYRSAVQPPAEPRPASQRVRRAQ
jgi:hypothetical protein